MKLRSLLSAAAVAATFSASAQTWSADTITMGNGYAKDVYYHMGTGTVKEDSNYRWDLAFSALPSAAMRTSPSHYGVGAWINSAVGASGTPVSLYSLHRSASTFATISGADTAGKLTRALVNSETSYSIGAFNTNGTGVTGNYGWGTYNTTTHNITGDSVYIAIKGTTAYKIWIEQYASAAPTWKFHVQKLDNSSPAQTVTLDISANFANRALAYYSFTNGPIDREPAVTAWDLNFTRYTAMISMGPGSPVPYGVTGVFINPYVNVRRAWKATADTTNIVNYTDSAALNVIGRDWKTSGTANGAYILDTANYFVKSTDGSYYQLEFTYASTSTLGKVAFRKRKITTSSVNTVNNTVANYHVAPVPANNQVSLMLDTKDATNGAVLMLTDVSGRTVYNQQVTVQKGMNTYSVNTSSLPAGMYVLSISGQNIRLAQKITVAH
jgi:hypothetical protein